MYFSTYVYKGYDIHAKPNCLCPMHEETEPSFRFFSNTNTFSCFGKCHIAGDLPFFHKSYLKHLLDIGDLRSYHQISNIKPDDLNYYNALEEIVKIFKLPVPPVFIDVDDKLDITPDEMYAYFTDKQEITKVNTTPSIKIIYKRIDNLLLKIKEIDYNSYRKYFLKKINYITSFLDNAILESKLTELYKEMMHSIGN